MNSKFTQDKISLRQKFKKKGDALSTKTTRDNSVIIFQKLVNLEAFLEYQYYLVYLPINNEVETYDLVNFLTSKRKDIYLPANNGGVWEIRRFYNAEKLEDGPFGTKQPKKGSAVVRDVDICVLPGVAFAKNGLRVGYGHGVYDLLLKKSKGYKIGICWDFQVVDSIKAEKHDVMVDVFVTEKKVYLLKK